MGLQTKGGQRIVPVGILKVRSQSMPARKMATLKRVSARRRRARRLARQKAKAQLKRRQDKKNMQAKFASMQPAKKKDTLQLKGR